MEKALIWQSILPRKTTSAMDNFFYAPSLTAALKKTGAQFSVKLLYMGELNAQKDNTIHPDIKASSYYVRDVLLYLNQSAVIRARSVCYPDSPVQKILDCGLNPLGERLFSPNHTAFERTPFEYTCLEHTHPLLSSHVEQDVWARRSLFLIEQSPLSLIECFLPELELFL